VKISIDTVEMMMYLRRAR